MKIKKILSAASLVISVILSAFHLNIFVTALMYAVNKEDEFSVNFFVKTGPLFIVLTVIFIAITVFEGFFEPRKKAPGITVIAVLDAICLLAKKAAVFMLSYFPEKSSIPARFFGSVNTGMGILLVAMCPLFIAFAVHYLFFAD